MPEGSTRPSALCAVHPQATPQQQPARPDLRERKEREEHRVNRKVCTKSEDGTWGRDIWRSLTNCGSLIGSRYTETSTHIQASTYTDKHTHHAGNTQRERQAHNVYISCSLSSPPPPSSISLSHSHILSHILSHTRSPSLSPFSAASLYTSTGSAVKRREEREEGDRAALVRVTG